MAVFPSNLPSPLQEGYSVAPVDQTVRSDMEVGAARVRRRTFARNDKVSLSWVFTDAQYQQFRAWFDTDINGGASWFDMSLKTGVSSAAVQARFAGSPKAQISASQYHWKVSAELEVRDA